MDKSVVPEFPADVPTATLKTLSLAKLLGDDGAEMQRLLQACIADGFFYLKLDDQELGADLDVAMSQFFSMADELTDIPDDEKRRFENHKNTFGYKNRQKDAVQSMRAEIFNISVNYLLGVIPEQEPPIFSSITPERKQFLASICDRCQRISTLLLRLLEKLLHLPNDSLVTLHNPMEISRDHISITKTDPAVDGVPAHGFNPHTDHGSVTFVFNNGIGGLQVRTKPSKDRNVSVGVEQDDGGNEDASAEWTFVRPLPNHVIVNVGDSLKLFTDGMLRSVIHRVVAPPGEQANHRRYSFVYFTSPHDTAAMESVMNHNQSASTDMSASSVTEQKPFITYADFHKFRMKAGPKFGIYEDLERKMKMGQAVVGS